MHTNGLKHFIKTRREIIEHVGVTQGEFVKDVLDFIITNEYIRDNIILTIIDKLQKYQLEGALSDDRIYEAFYALGQQGLKRYNKAAKPDKQYTDTPDDYMDALTTALTKHYKRDIDKVKK